MVGIVAPPVLRQRTHHKNSIDHHHLNGTQQQLKQQQHESSTSIFSFLNVCHILNALLTYIVLISTFTFSNSAINAMAFYGVYHRNPYNQFIHFFGVPGIIWSLLLFQCHLSIITNTKYNISFLPGIPNHSINWATIWLIIYTIFYCSIDLWGAIFYIPILYAMYGSSVYYVQLDQMKWKQQQQSSSSSQQYNNWMGTKQLLWISFGIHIFSWYIQIHLGHYIYEGAQPAVLQSLGGAITTAPLFAFYELIWYIGLRQQFHNDVLQQVSIYTQTLCEQGIKMRACTA